MAGSRRAPSYDWDEVFTFYAGLGPTRTHSQVVERFGMTQRTVERASKRYGWNERVDALDARAQERAEAVIVRERSKRIADTLRIIDAARTRFAGQLGRQDFKLTGAEFVGLVKLEALLEGEATDRISFEDFRAFTNELTRELEQIARSGKELTRETLAEALERAARAAAAGDREAA